MWNSAITALSCLGVVVLCVLVYCLCKTGYLSAEQTLSNTHSAPISLWIPTVVARMRGSESTEQICNSFQDNFATNDEIIRQMPDEVFTEPMVEIHKTRMPTTFNSGDRQIL